MLATILTRPPDVNKHSASALSDLIRCFASASMLRFLSWPNATAHGHVKDYLDIFSFEPDDDLQTQKCTLGLFRCDTDPNNPMAHHSAIQNARVVRMLRKSVNVTNATADEQASDSRVANGISSVFGLQVLPSSDATQERQCFASSPNDPETGPLNDFSAINN
ncbi:uncharacterized protein SCHCODRAFT_02685599 [Schizophyllum commune H4-8]|nr:uncharacterized protein SCHCODRAFT_02685599 [Schizophyllum commune H4-8]KAI5896659.1 hypothetical protein SCHCODRAFT_02685599 [Schizophyllum commune H4-8]